MPTINPGDNWQTAVNGNPNGTIFTIAPGTHRFATCVPKQGQQFIGSGLLASIITGARVLTGWTNDGSGRYFVGGQTQQNTNHDNNNCATGFPACSQPEQLWVNGVLYTPVTSLGALGPNKWFFDFAANRIYLSTNPGIALVETSVTPQLFNGGGTGVRIENLFIEKYACGSGHGVIDARAGWTIEACDIGNYNGTGVRIGGSNVSIIGGRIHHGGEQGIGGPSGDSLLVDGVEIDHHNTAGYGPGTGDHKAGGLKISHSANSIVRNCNVHDCGIGLWWDIDCQDALVDNVYVHDCTSRGIQYEISYGIRVVNSRFDRNGVVDACGFCAGVWISSSTNAEITGCSFDANNVAVLGTDRDRGSGAFGEYRLINLNVHHNNITQVTGTVAGVQDQSTTRDPYTVAANNRYHDNNYFVGTGVRWRWTNNAALTQAQWVAAGQDSGSTFNGPGSGIPTLAAGQWYYDPNTNTVYVRCTDSGNPNSKAMAVFDHRFGTDEIIAVRANGQLLGRICRHFSYVSDPSGAQQDAARGGGVSYDGSRVVFGSNWGGGPVGVYAVLTDPNA